MILEPTAQLYTGKQMKAIKPTCILGNSSVFLRSIIGWNECRDDILNKLFLSDKREEGTLRIRGFSTSGSNRENPDKKNFLLTFVMEHALKNFIRYPYQDASLCWTKVCKNSRLVQSWVEIFQCRLVQKIQLLPIQPPIAKKERKKKRQNWKSSAVVYKLTIFIKREAM